MLNRAAPDGQALLCGRAGGLASEGVPARLDSTTSLKPARSALRWVTRMTVVPSVAASTSAMSAAAVGSSRPAVGSSRSSTRPPASRARARATRWRWPLRVARPARPPGCRRRRAVCAPRPRAGEPQCPFDLLAIGPRPGQRHVRGDGPAKRSASWATSAMARRTSSEAALAMSTPPRCVALLERPEPQQCVDDAGLARPLAPTMATRPPEATARSQPSSAHGRSAP